MIACDVGGLAPGPGEMEGAVDVEGGLPIGVALSFTVNEIIMQTAPGFCFCVVLVEDQVPVAGGTVAVEEEEVAVGKEIEFRIRDTGFVVAGHRSFGAQVEGAGSYAAGVAEGAGVLVEAAVKEAVAVDDDADGAVGVAGVAGVLGLFELPGCAVVFAAAEDEAAGAVIESDVLLVFI